MKLKWGIAEFPKRPTEPLEAGGKKSRYALWGRQLMEIDIGNGGNCAGHGIQNSDWTQNRSTNRLKKKPTAAKEVEQKNMDESSKEEVGGIRQDLVIP